MQNDAQHESTWELRSRGYYKNEGHEKWQCNRDHLVKEYPGKALGWIDRGSFLKALSFNENRYCERYVKPGHDHHEHPKASVYLKVIISDCHTKLDQWRVLVMSERQV